MSENAPAPPRDRSYYMALIAIIISLVGTGVSIIEAKILRDQQALMVQESSASVWPYISVNKSIGTTVTAEGFTPTLALSLKNGGIGPAILSPRTIIFRGKTFSDSDAFNVFLEKTYPGLSLIFNVDIMDDGGIIPASETIAVLGMMLMGTAEGIEKLDLLSEISDDLELSLCYCSVYEECWQLTEDTHPERAEDCALKVNL
ncbi:hypothetical protein [Lewinella sp. W8]|uniref:hypothetical protein n=1 Tax=Lewinella sp. W8 TaxID=2528208 RepID=UPI001067C760|nr:hypothetical protein [Lewinella sp. W8]MTB50144.1 hypothetical protein [Lewinella sp. W8]